MRQDQLIQHNAAIAAICIRVCKEFVCPYTSCSDCCIVVSLHSLTLDAITCQQSMQTQRSLPNVYYMTCCFCSAVPYYAKIQGNNIHSVSTNPITGLSDVTFTYTVTSHWSSLAVIKSVYGQLTKVLASGDTVIDALSRIFTAVISLVVNAVCCTFWRCI